MVNPDGVAIETGGIAQAGRFAPLVRRVSKGDTHCWQANGRGVDLNHNFDAGWRDLRQREIAAGITEPAPTRFGGYYPESEPESHGLAQLCRREQFSMAAVLHSQGEEIYWQYGKHTPRCSLEIAHAMEAVSGYRVAFTGYDSPTPLFDENYEPLVELIKLLEMKLDKDRDVLKRMLIFATTDELIDALYQKRIEKKSKYDLEY